MKPIVLIGMAGAGKSTVGAELARVLGFSFLDIDRVLEAEAGKLLQKILDELGDDRFVDLEAFTTLNHSKRKNIVLAPGGSIIYAHKVMKALQERAYLVYLTVPLSVIATRIDIGTRSLVKGRNIPLEEIYRERIPLYEKYAHFTVVGGDTPEETAIRIRALFVAEGLIQEHAALGAACVVGGI